MNSVSQISVVLRRNTGNRNATVVGQIHRVLLDQSLHLLAVQAGEAEHTDLIGNVLPVVRGALFLQILDQRFPHGYDTIGHALDLLEPIFENISNLYSR